MPEYINEERLMRLAAEEVERPKSSAMSDFADLLDEIGDAANSTVTACILAIKLFTEAKKALQFRFAGKRNISFRQESTCNVFTRYLEG